MIKTLLWFSISILTSFLSDILNLINRKDYQSSYPNDSNEIVAISATKKENFDSLSQNVETGLLKATGKQFYKLQVPNGGQQLR